MVPPGVINWLPLLLLLLTPTAPKTHDDECHTQRYANKVEREDTDTGLVDKSTAFMLSVCAPPLPCISLSMVLRRWKVLEVSRNAAAHTCKGA